MWPGMKYNDTKWCHVSSQWTSLAWPWMFTGGRTGRETVASISTRALLPPLVAMVTCVRRDGHCKWSERRRNYHSAGGRDAVSPPPGNELRWPSCSRRGGNNVPSATFLCASSERLHTVGQWPRVPHKYNRQLDRGLNRRILASGLSKGHSM